MSKPESFEFLNELALAFRAAENHPRPQYAPVLEGVRAVLAHLNASGRLLRDDEMRLTAEQVGWVSLIVNDSNPMSLTLDAWERVRALFPATEPAEVKGRDFLDALPTEPDCWDVCEGHPTPAEPAEEETKAEGLWVHNNGEICVHAPQCAAPYVVGKFNAHGDFIKHAGELCLPEGFTRLAPASSPVVPAPTETGPWEDITKAPTHLTLIDVDGDHWAHDGDNWECLDGGYCGRGDAKSINKYAPFVAAEEG